jgi:Zn-dependent peptidase ImmA (M78 family)
MAESIATRTRSIVATDPGIEQEADAFAAALLMPFHDFRRPLPAKRRPNFDTLSRIPL